jgi:Flp pilus assembly protein TadB
MSVITGFTIIAGVAFSIIITTGITFTVIGVAFAVVVGTAAFVIIGRRRRRARAFCITMCQMQA